MCNYNHESRKAVSQFTNSFQNVQQTLGNRAYNPLLQAIRNGRAKKGHDLHDGQPLPPNSLSQGHYFSQKNFQRNLKKMNRSPKYCQWCGSRLPNHLTQQHFRPHDHREHIQHHFHPDCWHARLLAIAIIFGHVNPNKIMPKNHNPKPRRRKRNVIFETVEYVTTKIKTKRVYKPSRSRKRRRW